MLSIQQAPGASSGAALGSLHPHCCLPGSETQRLPAVPAQRGGPAQHHRPAAVTARGCPDSRPWGLGSLPGGWEARAGSGGWWAQEVGTVGCAAFCRDPETPWGQVEYLPPHHLPVWKAGFCCLQARGVGGRWLRGPPAEGQGPQPACGLGHGPAGMQAGKSLAGPESPGKSLRGWVWSCGRAGAALGHWAWPLVNPVPGCERHGPG